MSGMVLSQQARGNTHENVGEWQKKVGEKFFRVIKSCLSWSFL